MSQSLSEHESLDATLSTPRLSPSPSRCNWSYVAFYPIHVMVCGAVGVCTRRSRGTNSKHHMETRSWGLRRPSVGQVIVSSTGRWSRLLHDGVFFRLLWRREDYTAVHRPRREGGVQMVHNPNVISRHVPDAAVLRKVRRE